MMSRCRVREVIVVVCLVVFGNVESTKVDGSDDGSIIHSVNFEVGKRFAAQSSENENKSVDVRVISLAPNNVGLAANKYCDNTLSCLNREVYVTVVDILSHNLYKLSDNLVLERLPIANRSDPASDDSEVGRDVLREKNGVTTLVLMNKMMDIFRTHSLRLRLLRDMDIAVYREAGRGVPRLALALEANVVQRGGRTFGVMKRRIAFVLLAIMFKLGLMSAMLMMLIILTVKGLKLGVLLLTLTFANYTGKAIPFLPMTPYKPGMEELHSSVPPMHIHVHKDLAENEWQPADPYSPFPQDPGGPYPYPPAARTQAQLQVDIPMYPPVPSMRKTNPAYYTRKKPPGYVDVNEDLRYAASHPAAGYTPGYSVYYQKKNGQFYPVVINDAHRQSMANIGDSYDAEEERRYAAMYRANRRSEEVEEEAGDTGAASSYVRRRQ